MLCLVQLATECFIVGAQGGNCSVSVRICTGELHFGSGLIILGNIRMVRSGSCQDQVFFFKIILNLFIFSNVVLNQITHMISPPKTQTEGKTLFSTSHTGKYHVCVALRTVVQFCISSHDLWCQLTHVYDAAIMLLLCHELIYPRLVRVGYFPQVCFGSSQTFWYYTLRTQFL